MLTRTVLFEKEYNLYKSIIKSQDNGKINKVSIEILAWLCYRIFDLRYSKIMDISLREDVVIYALEFCIEKYDKFDRNRNCHSKMCQEYFSTLIYYRMDTFIECNKFPEIFKSKPVILDL